jgi:hypothetical protein
MLAKSRSTDSTASTHAGGSMFATAGPAPYEDRRRRRTPHTAREGQIRVGERPPPPTVPDAHSRYCRHNMAAAVAHELFYTYLSLRLREGPRPESSMTLSGPSHPSRAQRVGRAAVVQQALVLAAAPRPGLRRVARRVQLRAQLRKLVCEVAGGHAVIFLRIYAGD